MSSPVFAQYSGDGNKKEDPAPEWNPDSDRKSQIGKGDYQTLKTDKVTNFWVYGASIGSPGSVNLNLGYYYKDVVLRVSGGYWRTHWWGGQVDLGYSFWKTPVIAHSISIVGGAFQVDPFAPDVGRGGQNEYPTAINVPGYNHRDPTFEDQIIRSYVASNNANLATYLEYASRDRQKVHLHQAYIGLTYDILLGNFFLQVGAGSGPGDYRNPQLLIQLGYLFDTRSH
ncbi:hypothetical protein CH373_09910 [Leptospira perolatii]|uniref:Uncharacterized protein n=1 Tax=Leptospira perolatii TaxID=2023191 RepID=A0A2M9ZMT7_9LEPT|nr:hypothetical protein [Leptospira perolatii]PJZ70180.1 hypothetical protein CH360_07655 [Leptospira perolatii]PJZ73400.1 hypothetical protein CH373_09910 [Leptospira perolatii]